MKSKLLFLSYRVEVFQLMWSLLHVGPNYIFNFFYSSTHIFSIFLQTFVKNLSQMFFSYISSKIWYSDLFFFRKIGHMGFLFYKFFIHIFCIWIYLYKYYLWIIFEWLYFVYNFKLNKLYNFRFSWNNYDLDHKCYE